MTTDSGAGAPRFTIGGVLAASFAILFRNLFRFLAIVVAFALPVAALAWLGGLIVSASATTRGFSLNIQADGWSGAIYVLYVGAMFMAGVLLIHAAIAHGTLQVLRGERAGIGAAMGQAIGALPRAFLAGLLLLAAFVLVLLGDGFAAYAVMWHDPEYAAPFLAGSGLATVVVLLLLGAILVLLLATFCWVFLPAVVAERAGPIACFRRSVALTKGHRWGVFALMVLLALTNAGAGFVSDQARALGAPTAGDLIDLLFAVFLGLFTAVMAAVGYHRLRIEKEGIGMGDVAGVFD